MQINQFDGGLSTRLDASLIKSNEAVVYSNIDNTAHTLKNTSSFTKSSIEATDNAYKFKGNWLSSVNERDYVEYGGKLYFTEQDSVPKKFNGTVTSNLGIAAPLPNPVVESGLPVLDENYEQIMGVRVEFDSLVEGDILLATTLLEGDLPLDTYNYRIFVMSDDEQVFTFDKTIVLAAGDQSINFLFSTSNIIKLTKKHTDNKYYLLKSGKGVLVDNNETLDTSPGNEVIVDLSTTPVGTIQYTYTYYNKLDGVESAPAPLTAEYEWPAGKVVKLSNFTPSIDEQVTHIRIYRIGPDTTTALLVDEIANESNIIYYDVKLSSDLTDVLDSYDNQPPISGLQYLTEAYGIMFASKDNIVYFTKIGKPDYWPSVQQLQTKDNVTGFLPISGGILIFSLKGAVLLVGTKPVDFALTPVTSEQGCVNHKSCKLVKNIPVWISKDGICSWQSGSAAVISKDKLGKIDIAVINTAIYDETYWVLKNNGSILSMDLRFGMKFKEHNVGRLVKDIGVFDSILYGVIEDRIATLFTGEAVAMLYMSPAYADGAVTIHKLYANIYVKSKGQLTFEAWIDGELVFTKMLIEDKVYDLKIPAEKQRGYTIQFVVSGIGEIKEIEYKVVGRENGR